MNTIGQLGISPAPWKCSIGDDGYRPCICDADGRFMLAYAEKENSDANAALIAAAPDLYEALRLVLDTLEHYGFQPWFKDDPLAFAVKCGEKALEKAGGKE